MQELHEADRARLIPEADMACLDAVTDEVSARQTPPGMMPPWTCSSTSPPPTPVSC